MKSAKVFNVVSHIYAVHTNGSRTPSNSDACDIAFIDVFDWSTAIAVRKNWNNMGHTLMTLVEFKNKYTIPDIEDWNHR